MHPELTCTYCSTDEDRAARSEKDLKPDPVRELFLDFSHRVQQTLCGDEGYEGYLAIGAMLSYAAAAEIFASHSAFPGVLVHGIAGEGKSTMSRFLTHIFGFDQSAGLGSKATNVSTALGLGQYS